MQYRLLSVIFLFAVVIEINYMTECDICQHYIPDTDPLDNPFPDSLKKVMLKRHFWDKHPDKYKERFNS